MPIIVRLNPVAPLIGAAQGVGNFATVQAQQDTALRLQQDARQSQNQAFNQNLQEREFSDRQQQGQEDLDYKYALLDQNNQYRNNTLQNRTDLQQMRGDQGTALENMRELARTGRLNDQGMLDLQKLEAQQRFNLQRDQNRYDFRSGQGDLNRANAADIAQGRNDTANRNEDMRIGLGYDRLASQEGIADANRQGRTDLSQFNTDQQAQRRANEQDFRLQGAEARAQMQELRRRGAILEQRANRDPSYQNQYEIDQNNKQIQALLDANSQRQPTARAPAFVMPDNFQSGADVFAQGQAAPVQAPPQQQQAAPPTHIRDGNGVVWVFTGQLDANGEPLYQQVGQPQRPPAGPSQITSEQDYEALPSGAAYIAPDGSTRQKR